MLGIRTTHSQAALQRVSSYREGRLPVERLETWTGPLVDGSVQKLLLAFADAETIDIANSIPEKDFSFREEGKRGLSAYVGDATVDINFEQRTIVHHKQAVNRFTESNPSTCVLYWNIVINHVRPSHALYLDK